jgi:hypothetical protein
LWTTFLKEESLQFLNYGEQYEFRERDILLGGVSLNGNRKKLRLSLKDGSNCDKSAVAASDGAVPSVAASSSSTVPSSSETTPVEPSASSSTSASESEPPQQSSLSASLKNKPEQPSASNAAAAVASNIIPKRIRRTSGGVGACALAVDRRAVSEISQILESKGTLFLYLVDYSEEKEELEFNRSVHTCSVCFCDKMGTGFVRLRCGHAFCTECVSACYVTHIREGNVDGVKCLGVKCSEVPTSARVKAVVGDELFERFDSILLKRALENMNDMTYCPRTQCGKPVLLDPNGDKLASCSACSYRFCASCKMVYHGVEPCRFKAGLYSFASLGWVSTFL